MDFIKLSIAYPMETLHDFKSHNQKALMCLLECSEMIKAASILNSLVK